PSGAVWLFSPSQRAAFPRDDPIAVQPFAFADDIRLRGGHNFANVQAATLAATLLAVERATIAAAVHSFSGVPHRLEGVRVLEWVAYINDSASTARDGGVAALQSFAQPIVLVAGGNSKDLDASDFAAEAATRAKRIILLAGNATAEFAAAVRTAAAARARAGPI